MEIVEGMTDEEFERWRERAVELAHKTLASWVDELTLEERNSLLLSYAVSHMMPHIFAEAPMEYVKEYLETIQSQVLSDLELLSEKGSMH